MEEENKQIKTGDVISFSFDCIQYQSECYLGVVNVNRESGKEKKTLTLPNIKKSKDTSFSIFKQNSLETGSNYSGGGFGIRDRSPTISDEPIQNPDDSSKVSISVSQDKQHLLPDGSIEMSDINIPIINNDTNTTPVPNVPKKLERSKEKKKESDSKRIREHQSGDQIKYGDEVFFMNSNGEYLGLYPTSGDSFQFMLYGSLDNGCFFNILKDNLSEEEEQNTCKSTQYVNNNDRVRVMNQEQCLELDLSTIETNIKFKYSSNSPDIFKITLSNEFSNSINQLEKDDSILICHREGGYLSVLEDSLFFTLKPKISISLIYSTFSLVECDDQFPEEAIVYKIKHNESDKFISIAGNSKVYDNPIVLVEEKDSNHDGAKFQFHPDNKNSDKILSLLYNQHYSIQSLNDQFLHFTSSDIVGNFQQFHYDDFQIKQPSPGLFKDCKTFLKEFNNDSADESSVNIRKILDILLIASSDFKKVAIKLLVLNINQLVISLEKSKEKNSIDYIKCIYKILTIICSSRPKYSPIVYSNFYLLLKHTPIECYKHLLDLLIKVYENNFILLQSITKETIQDLFWILNKIIKPKMEYTKKEEKLLSRFLELLNILCVFKNSPITKNQQLLAMIFQLNDSYGVTLFVQFKQMKYVPDENASDIEDDNDFEEDIEDKPDDEDDLDIDFSNQYEIEIGNNKDFILEFKMFGSQFKRVSLYNENDFILKSLLLQCNLITGGLDSKYIKDQMLESDYDNVIFSTRVQTEFKTPLLYFKSLFIHNTSSYPVKIDFKYDPLLTLSSNNVELPNSSENAHIHPLKKVKYINSYQCSMCYNLCEGNGSHVYKCNDQKCASEDYTICENCCVSSKSLVLQSNIDTVGQEINNIKYYQIPENIHPHPLSIFSEDIGFYPETNSIYCDECGKRIKKGYHCTRCQRYDICENCLSSKKIVPQEVITNGILGESVVTKLIDLQFPLSTFNIYKSLKYIESKSKNYLLFKILCSGENYHLKYQYLLNIFSSNSTVKLFNYYYFCFVYDNSGEMGLSFFKFFDLLLQLHKKNIFELFITENNNNNILENWRKLYEGCTKSFEKKTNWALPDCLSMLNFSDTVINSDVFSEFSKFLKSDSIKELLIIRSLILNNPNGIVKKINECIGEIKENLRFNIGTVNQLVEEVEKLKSLLNSSDILEINAIEYLYNSIHPVLLEILTEIGKCVMKLSNNNITSKEPIGNGILNSLFNSIMDLLFNEKSIGKSLMRDNFHFLIEYSLTNGNIFEQLYNRILTGFNNNYSLLDYKYIEILISHIFSHSPNDLNPFYLEFLILIVQLDDSNSVLQYQTIITHSLLKYKNIIRLNNWFVLINNKFSPETNSTPKLNIQRLRNSFNRVPNTQKNNNNNNNKNNNSLGNQLFDNINSKKNLLNFIQLLSSCCKGNNSDSELHTRDIINIYEIVDILIYLSNQTQELTLKNIDEKLLDLLECQKSYIVLLYEVFIVSKIKIKIDNFPHEIVQIFINYSNHMGYFIKGDNEDTPKAKEDTSSEDESDKNHHNASKEPKKEDKKGDNFNEDFINRYVIPMNTIMFTYYSKQEDSNKYPLEFDLLQEFTNKAIKIKLLDGIPLLVQNDFFRSFSQLFEKFNFYSYIKDEIDNSLVQVKNQFDPAKNLVKHLPSYDKFILISIGSEIPYSEIAKMLKYHVNQRNIVMVSTILQILHTKIDINTYDFDYQVIVALLELLTKKIDISVTKLTIKTFNQIFNSPSAHSILNVMIFGYKTNPNNHLFKGIDEIILESTTMLRFYNNDPVPPNSNFPEKIQFCIDTFNFISSICKGTNNFIQENILFQPHTYNIYNNLVEFLIELSAVILNYQNNIHLYVLAISFIDCLKELAKNNPENQRLLSNSKISNCIYKILSIDFNILKDKSEITLDENSLNHSKSTFFLILSCDKMEPDNEFEMRKFIFLLLKKTIIDFFIKSIDNNNIKQIVSQTKTDIIRKTTLLINNTQLLKKESIHDINSIIKKEKNEITYKKELEKLYYTKFKRYNYQGKDLTICKFISIQCCYYIQKISTSNSFKNSNIQRFHTDLLNSIKHKIGRVELIYKENIESIYFPIPHYVHHRSSNFHTEIKEKVSKGSNTNAKSNVTAKTKKNKPFLQGLKEYIKSWYETREENSNESTKEVSYYYRSRFPEINFVKASTNIQKFEDLKEDNDDFEELRKGLDEYVYHEEIDWEQPTERLNTFMAWSRFTLRGIQNRNIFIERSRFLKGLVSVFDNMKLVSFVISVAINIILLYASKGSPGEIRDNLKSGLYSTMTVLSIIHTIISVLLFGSYLIKNTYTRYFYEIPPVKPDGKNEIPKYLTNANVNFNLIFIFYLLGLSLSVVGTVYNPFFFSFHIFFYSLNTEAIKMIIKEVFKHTKNLAIMFIFLVQTAYLMSIISYLFFSSQYEDGDNNPYCSTLAQCFVSNLYYSIISGGTVIDAFKFTQFSQNSNENIGQIIGWITFNLIFWIIMTIVLLNVILGIIVDSLGSMRDKKNDFQRYKTSNCFICNIKRDDFQKNELNFDYHVDIEHNKWNYLYYQEYLKNRNKYFLSLKLKDKKISINNKKSMEIYFIEQIYLRKFSTIFPIDKSLSLNSNNPTNSE